MHAKLLNDGGERSWALIFDEGDEVIATLRDFARENDLTGSHFTAIGAFQDVTLGYFDWRKKDYDRIPIREQVEVLTLAGDIALKDGDPKVHAHVVVGKRDGSAHGGHVLEAHVRPTLEVFLEEAPEALQREHDPETGLALIRV